MKCRISPLGIQAILDIVCRENSRPTRLLEDIKDQGDQKFTTGDVELDNALGGGIRTGMIWEVAGERQVYI
jgi:DNA repair protein RAD57